MRMLYHQCIKLVLFTISIFFINDGFGQCLDPRINSQADLESYFTNNPQCTSFLNITISGDVTDLSVMENLMITSSITFEDCTALQNFETLSETVEFGNLRVINSSISSLNGLEHINSFGSLTLEGTDIVNLAPLEQLTNVWTISLKNNINLVNINQFSNLDTLTSGIWIEGNENLDNISGLSNIKKTGTINIKDQNLNNLSGLENLDSITTGLILENIRGISNLNELIGLQFIDRLSFTNMPDLENVDGLSSISTIETLRFENLDSLSSIVILDQVAQIGSIEILDNDALTEIGSFNNITTSSSIRINDNPKITSIAGFNQLPESFFVDISENNSLLSIDGFNSVTSIDKIYLSENENLSSISGFSNIFEINDFTLQGAKKVTSLNLFNNITHLYTLTIKDNSMLSSLTGFSKLDSVRTYLEIEDNPLEDISGLQSVSHVGLRLMIRDVIGNPNLSVFSNLERAPDILLIERLENLISLEGLSNMDIIDSRLEIIDCPNLVSISALRDKLPQQEYSTRGFRLKLRNLALPSLDGLEGLIYVKNLELELLDQLNDIEALASLTAVDILELSNISNLENLNGLRGLNSIYGDFIINRLNALKNFDGLNNLKLIGDDLSITKCNELKSLSGLESLERIGSNLTIRINDKLETLDGTNPLLNVIRGIELSLNPKLRFCNNPFICRKILENGTIEFDRNGAFCKEQSINLSDCGLDQINIQSFLDLNQNKNFDLNEFIINNVQFYLNDIALYQIFDGSSDLQTFGVLNQNNILSFKAPPYMNLTTDSISYNLNIDNLDPPYKFGFSVDSIFSDVQNFITYGNIRCLTKVDFDIATENLGSTINAGILWLELDNAIDSLYFIDLPDTIIGSNTIGYIFEDNAPGNIVKKSISLLIPGPPDFELGDSIYLKSWTEYLNSQGEFLSDTTMIIEEILCSYDPNDKKVLPKHPDNLVLFNETLQYTIRFQNTGNAEAYDVIIRDTLDPNLDVSTFKLIGSSHENILNTFIKDEQYITFEFKNIFLPDSTTDFEGSNGYVSYIIEHNEGIDENTKIENTAHIYFDFNPPIVTNTTENILVSMFPTSTKDLYLGLDINIYPNPTDGILYFDGEDLEWDAMVEIVDLTGKVVMQNQLSGLLQVNLHQLNSGVYFVHVIQENGRFSGKVIVE